MLKKVSSLFVLLVLTTSLLAQHVRPVQIEGRPGQAAELRMLCENDAGQVTLRDGAGNIVMEDLIYLAFGDSLLIENQGGNASNDPNNATIPGIGYIFYDCEPTVSGTTYADLVADSCLNQQDSIFLAGQWVQRNDAFWATSGDTPDGNLTFVNDGTLQTAFNNGDFVQFHFAPVTFNYFDSLRFEADPSTGTTGPCVNIGTTEAFSVVYLNTIEITNLQNSREGLACIGSFRLAGGLPEAQNGQRYSISIVNDADNSVVGTVENASVSSGDSVRFFVPEPGTYTITVTDEAGSSTTSTVDMAGCMPVTFSLPFQNARPGDQVCLPVYVENFTDVGVMQFDMAWDESVLDYDQIQNIHPDMADANLNNSSFTIDAASGTLGLSWPFPFALPDGITLPDSSILFEICFNVVGDFGDNSPVSFVESATPNETIGNDNPTPLGYQFNAGQVNVSSAVLFSDISVDDITCNPGNNGSTNDGAISITVAQGTGPYPVRLSQPIGGDITETLMEGVPFKFSGLPPGDYTINITDNSDPVNSIDTVVTIQEPDEFIVRLDEIDPSCFGYSDGSISSQIIINSAVVPNPESLFSFDWNITEVDTSIIDSLGAGFPISVTATDMNGCQASASTALSSPASITFTPTLTPAQCSGQNNGSVQIDLSKPSYSGTFDLSWATLADDIGVTTVTKPNLLPGTYYVTATDASGCAQADSFTVGTLKTLNINLAIDNVLCNGEANGQIIASGSSTPASGEVLPYSFTWAGPTGTETASDNVSSTFSDLIAGTYTVTMEDGDNCSTTMEATVTEPEVLDITVLEREDETCNDDDNDGIPGRDGLARVEGTGGTAPYTYLWIREVNRPDTMFIDTVSTDSVAMNLVLSTYEVFVTDANGCVDSLEIDINAPAPPQITSLENDTLNCSADMNGALSVTAINGNGNITSYEWDNGAFGPSITNLSPGIYRVRISADDGCVTIDSALVFAPQPIMVDSITQVQPRCPGSSNGSLTVFASGGTMPYTYIWEDTPLNDTTFNNLRPGLRAGNYQVTVTDANDCPSVTETATLTDPPAIELSFSDVLPVSCFEGSNDGEARVSVNYSDGSTGLFTINWGSGAFAEDVDELLADNLSAGLNTVTAIDGNNCSGTDTVDIPSPPAIELTLAQDNVTCNGDDDGSAEVTAMGGTPPFRYDWPETGSTTPTNDNLAPGIYTIRVIDDRDCVQDTTLEITEPDPLDASADLALTNDPLCNGDTNGQIAVQVNSEDNINPLGDMPYTWSNGAPADSAVASGLAAGDYSVIVTDVNGCTDEVTFSLVEPTPVQATITNPPDPRCFGEATFFTVEMASGGVGMDPMDYTFQVDRNGLNFPLGQQASVFAGDHIVTVEDPNGCIFEDSITVNQPEEISVQFTPATITVELGDSTTTLNPIVTSSLPLDSIAWSPGDFLSATNVLNPVVNPLQSQQYTLTIADINGCTASASLLVDLDRNRNVYVPNAISPNGDGRNDEFRLFACRGVGSVLSARVFDRWGGLVYESIDMAPVCDGGLVLWDGEINGEEAPIGVYVYIIEVEFIDGVTLTYRGDVSVVR